MFSLLLRQPNRAKYHQNINMSSTILDEPSDESLKGTFVLRLCRVNICALMCEYKKSRHSLMNYLHRLLALLAEMMRYPSAIQYILIRCLISWLNMPNLPILFPCAQLTTQLPLKCYQTGIHVFIIHPHGQITGVILFKFACLNPFFLPRLWWRQQYRQQTVFA